MDFIVYNSDGTIIRTGSCVDADFSIQAGENELVIEGVADDSRHMIVDGKVVNKPDPEPLTDVELNKELLINIRYRRKVSLSNSDWTQMPDSPLSDAKKQEWSTYRQALRDLPETYIGATSIDDIIWPTKPE